MHLINELVVNFEHFAVIIIATVTAARTIVMIEPSKHFINIYFCLYYKFSLKLLLITSSHYWEFFNYKTCTHYHQFMNYDNFANLE